MADNELELNTYQTLLHQVPPGISIAALTGRGAGKSTGFATLMLRGAVEHGADYRALYIRRTYKGLADFEDVLRDIFGRAFGPRGYTYNQTDMVLRANGCYIELNELGDVRAYDKVQGRSFVDCFVDEAQQFSDMRLINMLRSNLRSPNVPTRMILGANPMGPSHMYLRDKHLAAAPAWTPYMRDGVEWINAPGDYRMNNKIDRDQYARDLRASTIGNTARRKAWLENDWYAADAGSFFARAFDHERNVMDFDPEEWGLGHRTLWEPRLSHDWGYAAPSVTLLGYEAMDGAIGPDGRSYAKGSVIFADEYASCPDLEAINVGSRETIPELTEHIHAMCQRWKVRPRGVADDAIAAPRGDQPRTFQDEFKRVGINFKSAKKGERVPSYARLTRFLADAGHRERPGLFINARCKYLLTTLPMIQRDEKNPDDAAKCDVDHGVDAARYYLTPDKSKDAWMHTQQIDWW